MIAAKIIASVSAISGVIYEVSGGCLVKREKVLDFYNLDMTLGLFKEYIIKNNLINNMAIRLAGLPAGPPKLPESGVDRPYIIFKPVSARDPW